MHVADILGLVGSGEIGHTSEEFQRAEAEIQKLGGM